MKELRVTAIENGVVIDHVNVDNVFKIVKILDLEEYDDEILIGANLHSERLGKKAVIKISGRFLDDDEISKIALLANGANVNFIDNFEVVGKKAVAMPNKICGIVKCFNPKCITNHERVETCFSVVSKKKVQLKCKYCEKITDEENFVFV